MKTLFRAIFGLCLMAMFWMPMSAQESATRGDVDNDKDVTISDVTALIDYLLKGSDDPRIAVAADVDQDNAVTISDVTALIDYLLKGEWPYAAQVEEITVGTVTFRMIPVQGGTFTMGGRESDPYVRPWETPAHEVTLSDYYIAETEVTQALWKAVMGNNPSYFRSYNGYTDDFQRPVESVSYSQCKAFINRLNQKTGKVFRMLTEAEWEYAARGGRLSKGYLYAGSDSSELVGWYNGTAGKMPHPVASLQPNELGLYDMSGNIEEWVSDYYGLYTEEPQTNPQGPASGTYHVSRGGNWDSAFRGCRVTYRYDAYDAASSHYGLRLAM